MGAAAADFGGCAAGAAIAELCIGGAGGIATPGGCHACLAAASLGGDAARAGDMGGCVIPNEAT